MRSDIGTRGGTGKVEGDVHLVALENLRLRDGAKWARAITAAGWTDDGGAVELNRIRASNGDLSGHVVDAGGKSLHRRTSSIACLTSASMQFYIWPSAHRPTRGV